MQLSVVVPTLNGRERLSACLDALSEHAPEAELVVVNGPSADGTPGMLRDREDVDVLVQISERNLNVARNAGLAEATGDVVALVGQDLVVEPSWRDGLAGGFDRGADVVTGPTHRLLHAGMTTESSESRTIAGREVTYFSGSNVAFSAEAVSALDGFDEYLEIGGARDGAHRLAEQGHAVEWAGEMSVRREYEADGGVEAREWRWKYRSLAYRLVKNYGIRPTVIRRTFAHAGKDAIGVMRDVAGGEATPTSWVGTGRDVLTNIAIGSKDGLVARARDRTPRRNPHGISSRGDRAVERFDRRPSG